MTSTLSVPIVVRSATEIFRKSCEFDQHSTTTITNLNQINSHLQRDRLSWDIPYTVINHSLYYLTPSTQKPYK